MPTLLISGANRGLGLEFTGQYLADGWHVVAAARSLSTADELKALAGDYPARLRLVELDVAVPGQITRLAAELGGTALDILLHNAGVLTRRDFGGSSWEEWEPHLRVNSYAPLCLAEAFAPHLERAQGAKFVNLSSVLGSITSNRSGGLYAYRASKAAATAVLKSLAIDLAPRGITVLSLHPGWVRTRMGRPDASLDATTSVRGMRSVIAASSTEDSGIFRQWDGTPLPW
jgi:NAD(P)-dependent dehydrogenase (short-subunit alcohol dehydrogenase family)